MMKYIYLLVFSISFHLAKAQDGVGINTESIDGSAVFEIESTDKGILIPRMSLAQRTAISSPATGLLVFQNSGAQGFYYYTGSEWSFLSDGEDWTETPSYLYTNQGKNVGIGNTTPDTDLHLYSEDDLTLKLQRESASDTAAIEFYRSTGTGTLDASVGVNANEEMILQNHNQDKDIKFLINDGGSVSQIMYFDASNKRIGVNLTSVPQDLIHANGAVRANSGFKANDGSGTAAGFRFYNDNNTGMIRVGNDHLGFVTGGTTALQIDASGNLLPGADNSFSLGDGSNRWTAVYSTNGSIQTSDRNLKTNIAPLQYGLPEVLKLNPVQFNWKTDVDKDKIGLIAQEVALIVPEVVSTDANDRKGVNYAELITVLITAIQELDGKVNELEAELNQIKGSKP